MKSVNKTMFCYMLALFSLYACSETELQPIEKNTKAPGKVNITDIENTPGGAVITYTLPDDPDLLYVMARYEEKDIPREFKASFYTNRLVIDGLSKEEEYTVELTAVNRSGKASEVVAVKIIPLKPPVRGVFESLRGMPTFGGIEISYENPSKAFVAIGVLTTDAEGLFYEHDTYYSSQPGAKFSVRGFGEGEREFRLYVKDKWGNVSDTTSFKVTPIGETELDKNLFREMKLKGDAESTAWGGQMRFIWDGRAFGDNEGDWGLHTGNVATNAPMFVTFDLGVVATLSRFKLWPIMDDKHMYNDMSPRNYEIWGRTEPVSASDNGDFFPYWFKIGEIENIKPSGLPTGTLTDDDRTAARRGDELVLDYNVHTTRYIRIRCTKNWNGNTNMCFSEVSFWATSINTVN
ncbi:MAG: DUF4959 domain-containing protein, partial [Tannerella sp.]|jgi:hypothetical protein|nr:DUF4959 domain-containing protein [Tannerella sp.]